LEGQSSLITTCALQKGTMTKQNSMISIFFINP
jgi:hypothetical protein